jgi:hypothetical protein
MILALTNSEFTIVINYEFPYLESDIQVNKRQLSLNITSNTGKIKEFINLF